MLLLKSKSLAGSGILNGLRVFDYAHGAQSLSGEHEQPRITQVFLDHRLASTTVRL